MDNVEPQEVNAIAGKILGLVHEQISASDDILIVALKLAAVTVEETRLANYGAKVRAEMYLKMRTGK